MPEAWVRAMDAYFGDTLWDLFPLIKKKFSPNVHDAPLDKIMNQPPLQFRPSYSTFGTGYVCTFVAYRQWDNTSWWPKMLQKHYTTKYEERTTKIRFNTVEPQGASCGSITESIRVYPAMGGVGAIANCGFVLPKDVEFTYESAGSGCGSDCGGGCGGCGGGCG